MNIKVGVFLMRLLQEVEVDYKVVGDTKPPYSYASLICMAMKANQNKMTLSAIYKWIKENFLFYRNADPSWQVSSFSSGRFKVPKVVTVSPVDH